MEFNNQKSNVMHVDINSCFATIEQQANPLLRGKPIVVAAYSTPRGCILAASVEAKRLGIKTGMMVGNGRAIYPKLIVLSPDPQKYRNVHKKLHKLLLGYSPEVTPKSIDEFVLKLDCKVTPYNVALEIKERIKKEIGEWITVSIGISTNRYLAKIAAGLKKPDGLEEINSKNYSKVFSKLSLTNLTGIKARTAVRFNILGVHSVLDLYNYEKDFYWYSRLHGYEMGQIESGRKSFSNEVSLKISEKTDITAIASRLFEKASARARRGGFRARKKEILVSSHKISVRLFDLVDNSNLQLDFFGSQIKKEKLEQAVDKINGKWGDFKVTSARSLGRENIVLDRISFGGVSDL